VSVMAMIGCYDGYDCLARQLVVIGMMTELHRLFLFSASQAPLRPLLGLMPHFCTQGHVLSMLLF